MPRIIFVIFIFYILFFFKFNFLSLKKKSTCQVNIMPRVRISFLYSIWSQYSL